MLPPLLTSTTRSTVRRLVDISKNRARLFDQTGALIADSARLIGPSGQLEIEMLPPKESDTLITRLVRRLYDWSTAALSGFIESLRSRACRTSAPRTIR